MIKIAVQFNYVAKKGWKPQNEDNYVITLLKAELSDSAIAEAKKSGKNTKQLFEEAAGTVAAESSTGTWTKVYDGKDSGIPLALRKKALAYDLDNENFMFKIAYPLGLYLKEPSSSLTCSNSQPSFAVAIGGFGIFSISTSDAAISLS